MPRLRLLLKVTALPAVALAARLNALPVTLPLKVMLLPDKVGEPPRVTALP